MKRSLSAALLMCALYILGAGGGGASSGNGTNGGGSGVAGGGSGGGGSQVGTHFTVTAPATISPGTFFAARSSRSTPRTTR